MVTNETFEFVPFLDVILERNLIVENGLDLILILLEKGHRK